MGMRISGLFVPPAVAITGRPSPLPVFTERSASAAPDGFDKQPVPMPLPVVEVHEGIHVVRDDLLPGGTKARFLYRIFERHDEVVYPSCTWGGAQVALAVAAKATGKKAVLFVPKRKDLHPRTRQAIRAAGAEGMPFRPGERGQLVMDSPHLKVVQVPMGFLNVLRARAKAYCAQQGAHFLEVGAKSAWSEAQIAEAARQVEEQYGPFDEVWCAAGSGTLARGLQRGFRHPGTRFFAVQVGMDIGAIGQATVIRHPHKLEKPLRDPAPFPSCPHYDRKAWQECRTRHGSGRILFWNVMGDLT